MLKEGKAFIDDAKGEVEGVVGQLVEAKEQALGLWETVTGLWSWAQSLWLGLTGKPITTKATATRQDAPQEQKQPVAKKTKKKVQQQELTYEEFQARQVHEICEQLKVYFDVMRQLKAHCRELEEKSLTTENVAESAIDRIEIEWQMKQLASQLNHAMVYGTPEDLGLGAMYEKIGRAHV